jgi:hypothetical protein
MIDLIELAMARGGIDSTGDLAEFSYRRPCTFLITSSLTRRTTVVNCACSRDSLDIDYRQR